MLQNQEIQEEHLEGLDDFKEEMMPDLNTLVRKYIDNFFHDKELHCGGPIPKKLLHSPHYIVMVINTTVSNAVIAAFKSLDHFAENENLDDEGNDGIVTDDMKTVIAIQNHTCERRIPKEYSGGVMLMYLELCKGIPVCELLPDEMVKEEVQSSAEPSLAANNPLNLELRDMADE